MDSVDGHGLSEKDTSQFYFSSKSSPEKQAGVSLSC